MMAGAQRGACTSGAGGPHAAADTTAADSAAPAPAPTTATRVVCGSL